MSNINQSRSKEECSMEKAYLTRNKKKGKWDRNSSSLGGDKSCCCGLKWPPKYYTCSFCKRGFKSAQALGGHMNVHRKDRAKMTLFSSWVLEYKNSNSNYPNPNSVSLSSDHSANFLLYSHSHSFLSDPSLTSTPFSSPPHYGENQRKSSIPQQRGLSKEKTVSPFLEVGGVTAGLDLERGFKDSKEVLDLELRLGYF